MFKQILLFSLLFLFLVNFSVVFASENVTEDMNMVNSDLIVAEKDFENQVSFCDENSDDLQERNFINGSQTTNLKSDGVFSYYKEKTELYAYLTDENNQPIQNKSLKVQVADNIYDALTDKTGKATFAIGNLKPNTYNAKIYFDGDDDYAPSQAASTIKIKKAPLAIKMSNYNTYVNSDLFFKVKIYNTITKNAVNGIRVKFIVYNTKTKKYSYYFTTTDKNGIAKINKNLKVGKYKVSTKIDDSKNKKYIFYKKSNKKVSLNIKATKEKGCCSFYLQVSGTESIAGFRRDGTEVANILIKSLKIGGKSAIKQYKTNYGYFFHSITTADGWMTGNGGIEGKTISKAIEKIACNMIKSNSIKTSSLKKILKYKRQLNFGHFSIKAPNGKFAIVWKSGYVTGKLKPGEFISVPNVKAYYRHGNYAKYSSNPVKAAVKVGATDSYGINRRDVTVFHWKATSDKNFKTTSSIKCYGANDNGKLVGKSTSKLKDNIYFKNKFFSKNKLPKTPNYLFLGSHSFGNIDKLIKTPTVIKAPAVSNVFNQTKFLKISVKNKKTGNAISGVKVLIKLKSLNNTVKYYAKTDSKGIINFNTKDIAIGKYNVTVLPNNNKYLIFAKSTIVIK